MIDAFPNHKGPWTIVFAGPFESQKPDLRFWEVESVTPRFKLLPLGGYSVVTVHGARMNLQVAHHVEWK